MHIKYLLDRDDFPAYICSRKEINSAKLSANNCSIATPQGRLEPAAFFLSLIIGSILSFAQATRERM